MNLRDRMQVKLVDAKQEARMLSVMALNSSLPPEYRQLVKMLECLARTEAKLRRSALDQLALDSKAKTMGWSPIRPVDGADKSRKRCRPCALGTRARARHRPGEPRAGRLVVT